MQRAPAVLASTPRCVAWAAAALVRNGQLE
jgi:hypothetical protein